MPGLLRGVARTAVVAGTAATVAGRVNRRQQQRWASQDAEAQAQEEQAQPMQQTNGSDDDVYTQLEKLGSLKDQGYISQQEFDAKKQQLLGL